MCRSILVPQAWIAAGSRRFGIDVALYGSTNTTSGSGSQISLFRDAADADLSLGLKLRLENCDASWKKFYSS